MNCKQAKAEIALWVGSDLNESAERSLRRHVAKCPDCRKHLRKMEFSTRILQETGEAPGGTAEPSLWPRVSAALSADDEQNAGPGRFNGWVPALAVAAACLAMVSLSNTTPPERSSDDALRVQPIGGGMQLLPESLPELSPDAEPIWLESESTLEPRKAPESRSAEAPKRKNPRRLFP